MADWKKRAVAVEPSWKDRATTVKESDSIGLGESLLKGVQKGTTFNLADEIAGIAGALGGKSGGDVRPFSDIYTEAKQGELEQQKMAEEANPSITTAGQILGGLLIPGGAAKTAVGGALSGGVQGAAQGFGEGEGTLDSLLGAGKQGLVGAGVGATFSKLAPLANKAIQGIESSTQKGAESLARSATGASGELARKGFKDGTEELLLNKGIVGFGDTVENIAVKAQSAKDEAQQVMSNLINQAEVSGSGVRAKDLLDQLDSQIANIAPDASKASTINELQSIKQNILNAANGNENSMISPSLIEKTKSGFQSNSNYMVPGMDEAQKIAGGIYRQAGEDLVAKTGPENLNAFMKAKNEFGTLSPVVEAAEKKASALNQASNLGLLDVTSAGAGAAALGPLGAVVGPVLQRQIRARGTATAAATLNLIPRTIEGMRQALPSIMQTNPQLGMAIQGTLNLPKERALRVLGPMISSLSDQMEPGEYPSLFEGKLHDEQDKSAYQQKIKIDLENDPIQRAKAQSALNKDGTVTLPQTATEPLVQAAPVVRRQPLTTTDMANRAGVKERAY